MARAKTTRSAKAEKASGPMSLSADTGPSGQSWMPAPVSYADALAAQIAVQPALVSNGTGGRVLPPDQHFGT